MRRIKIEFDQQDFDAAEYQKAWLAVPEEGTVSDLQDQITSVFFPTLDDNNINTSNVKHINSEHPNNTENDPQNIYNLSFSPTQLQNDLILSVDGFTLPPSQHISIVQKDDLVRVKVKKNLKRRRSFSSISAISPIEDEHPNVKRRRLNTTAPSLSLLSTPTSPSVSASPSSISFSKDTPRNSQAPTVIRGSEDILSQSSVISRTDQHRDYKSSNRRSSPTSTGSAPSVRTKEDSVVSGGKKSETEYQQQSDSLQSISSPRKKHKDKKKKKRSTSSKSKSSKSSKSKTNIKPISQEKDKHDTKKKVAAKQTTLRDKESPRGSQSGYKESSSNSTKHKSKNKHLKDKKKKEKKQKNDQYDKNNTSEQNKNNNSQNRKQNKPTICNEQYNTSYSSSKSNTSATNTSSSSSRVQPTGRTGIDTMLSPELQNEHQSSSSLSLSSLQNQKQQQTRSPTLESNTSQNQNESIKSPSSTPPPRPSYVKTATFARPITTPSPATPSSTAMAGRGRGIITPPTTQPKPVQPSTQTARSSSTLFGSSAETKSNPQQQQIQKEKPNQQQEKQSSISTDQNINNSQSEKTTTSSSSPLSSSKASKDKYKKIEHTDSSNSSKTTSSPSRKGSGAFGAVAPLLARLNLKACKPPVPGVSSSDRSSSPTRNQSTVSKASSVSKKENHSTAASTNANNSKYNAFPKLQGRLHSGDQIAYQSFELNRGNPRLSGWKEATVLGVEGTDIILRQTYPLVDVKQQRELDGWTSDSNDDSDNAQEQGSETGNKFGEYEHSLDIGSMRQVRLMSRSDDS